jgi:DNA (cytosine-5)-methyltransferase 1
MNRYKLPEACRLQGLPEDFLDHAPFTAQGKLQAVANGVPLAMGRAIARAVKQAAEPAAEVA